MTWPFASRRTVDALAAKLAEARKQRDDLQSAVFELSAKLDAARARQSPLLPDWTADLWDARRAQPKWERFIASPLYTDYYRPYLMGLLVQAQASVCATDDLEERQRLVAFCRVLVRQVSDYDTYRAGLKAQLDRQYALGEIDLNDRSERKGEEDDG